MTKMNNTDLRVFLAATMTWRCDKCGALNAEEEACQFCPVDNTGRMVEEIKRRAVGYAAERHLRRLLKHCPSKLAAAILLMTVTGRSITGKE